jgi:uroporphyrinogen-III decarboxylase
VEHAVSTPADVEPLQFIYAPPGPDEREWFHLRMEEVSRHASELQVPVQAWTGFGMDAVVWFTGTENAIMMSMDEPKAFHRLVDVITETDIARTELAASHKDVDIVVERGWYSSTDFWSPSLFDEFLYDHIAELAKTAHSFGKKFGYVMTTGVEVLGPRLADAGVDVLYFIDPIDPIAGGTLDLQNIRSLLSERMTLVGGVSSLSLGKEKSELEIQVREAIETFGPTNRFILHPVDAVFPDTPWEGIENLIDLWKEYR